MRNYHLKQKILAKIFLEIRELANSQYYEWDNVSEGNSLIIFGSAFDGSNIKNEIKVIFGNSRICNITNEIILVNEIHKLYSVLPLVVAILRTKLK